ncbi:methyltransferase family protein [Curtanaerobium respiraculi]|uniref:methyltransferase family protein n=1 Tax=Curtanaerobium respiraculi TaxID=2949669 RepID=UPI0024B3BC55|nr:isoprenylcysteine carboxylmethyltransferase family protein [Curtanaerobium respiraculi]
MRGKREHLPVIGVGPLIVGVMITLTAVGIAAVSVGLLAGGAVHALEAPFRIAGIALIAAGIGLWFWGVVPSRIDERIKRNELATDGAFAVVRNPIYSAFFIACTGATLIACNRWLLLIPFVLWVWMTVMLKLTEERWLLGLHGQLYADYCLRVNRCIPWFAKGRRENEGSA